MALALSHHNPSPPAPWEAAEIERLVLRHTCDSLGLNAARITLESRIGIEIAADSLDIVELIQDLENTFHISLSEESAQQLFTTQPVSLRLLAETIRGLIASEPSPRIASPSADRRILVAETVPCTQLGGSLSVKEWLAGPLYETMGCNREGHPQFRRRADGMRCVLVPDGEAMIGDSDPNGLPDQRPAHPVELSSFLIDAEPVSNAAYARFLNSVGPIPPSILAEWCLIDGTDRRERFFPLRRSWWSGWQPVRGTEQQPIILISWYGANAYTLWANRRDWRRYRGDHQIPSELQDKVVDVQGPPAEWLGSFLPSEAQWEYAAQGTAARRYPWGDEAPTPERLRVACHVHGAAYDVTTLPAARVSERLGMSPFGLHHMAGNVWQWCRDWYAADFYQQSEALRRNAQNERATGIRSERGGSWVGPAHLACCAYRRGRPPRASGRCLGFRCVGRREEVK